MWKGKVEAVYLARVAVVVVERYGSTYWSFILQQSEMSVETKVEH